MNAIATLSASLLLASAAVAQLAIPVVPSGQPVLAGIRPELVNTIPLPVVEVAGNPAFQIRAVVVTPSVPVGSPMFLLLGPPAAAPITVPAGLLSPIFGGPGFLAMPEISLIVPMTVAGTFGTPPYSLPIPPGLGALGHVLNAQIAVFTPGGIGLTGATGIVL